MKVGGREAVRKKSIDLNVSSSANGIRQSLKATDSEKTKLQFRRICKHFIYFCKKQQPSNLNAVNNKQNLTQIFYTKVVYHFIIVSVENCSLTMEDFRKISNHIRKVSRNSIIRLLGLGDKGQSVKFTIQYYKDKSFIK